MLSVHKRPATRGFRPIGKVFDYVTVLTCLKILGNPNAETGAKDQARAWLAANLDAERFAKIFSVGGCQ